MPGPVPVTTPVAVTTVAVPGALLVHVPPGAESLSAVVAPAQTYFMPLIAEGARFTMTDAVATQPADVV